MITKLASYGFAAGADGVKLLGAGWAPPTATGAWSVKRAARVVLPASAGATGVALHLNSQTQHAITRHRRITVSINGHPAGERRIGGACVWQIDLPAAAGPIELALQDRTHGAGDRQGICLAAVEVFGNTHAPVPPAARPLRELRFSWNDSNEDWLGEGWGTPEDAYVWAIGGRSTLHLPVPPDRAPALALLDMHPSIRDPQPRRQRVLVHADGVAVASLDLREELNVAIPLRPALGQSSVALAFRNLDADFETTDPFHHFGKPFAWFLISARIVPALPGYLPGARPRLPGTLADGSLQRVVEMLTGLPAPALAARFEGLGNGCELGQLQQALGHDRSGLLRFAAIRQRQLVEGILHGFYGIARADQLVWAVRREEDDTWRLIEQAYGVSSATPYSRYVAAPGFRAESRRLPRLADKLMEDIAAAERIFVLRISEPATEPAALAVLAALRRFGEAEMVWLVTDGTQPAGSAERLPCGLVRGHLEAPETGRPISPDTMMSALANAFILLRQAMPLPPG
jgi:hypothetical protein